MRPQVKAKPHHLLPPSPTSWSAENETETMPLLKQLAWKLQETGSCHAG